jgi:DNA primase
MPEGLDPDEIVARNPEEWKVLIENAKPVVTHVMDTLVIGQNLSDLSVKNRIATQVLPLIQDLPSVVDRETFRQQLERLLKVKEGSLSGGQAPGVKVKRPKLFETKQARESASVVLAVSSSRKVEAYIIASLFRRPELLYRLDRFLGQYGLNSLAAADFEYTDYQMLFDLIRAAVEQDQTEHHEFVVGALPESLRVLSRELLAQTEKLEPVEEKLMEELLRGVIKLRRVAAGENLNQLRFLQEDAQQTGDLRAASYQDLVLQHIRLLRDLDQANRKMTEKRLQ